MKKIIITLVVFGFGCSASPRSKNPRFGAVKTAEVVEVVKTPAACDLAEQDKLFIQEFSSLVEVSAPLVTGKPTETLPISVFAGAKCVYEIGRQGKHKVGVVESGAFAGKEIYVRDYTSYKLPDGADLKPGIHSYTIVGETGGPYFVLSLMDLWSQHPMASQVPNATEVILGIAIHEFFHTYQGDSLAKQIAALKQEGDILGDDEVQKALSTNEIYSPLHQSVIDGLWKAVAATEKSEALKIIAQTMSLYDQRRLKLKELAPRLHPFEPFFINVEGVGELARYTAFMNTKDIPQNTRLAELDSKFTGWSKMRSSTSAEVIAMMRSGRRKWSQDEGLALMLLIQKYHADWQGVVNDPNVPDLYELVRLLK